MRRFSAQFIFTNTEAPLKRAIITADDDGIITGIDKSGTDHQEPHSVEFYNGIIVPGFVNCHCHLELSHLKGIVPGGRGLADFIMHIRSARNDDPVKVKAAAASSDHDMYIYGTELCADICNTTLSFDIKKGSRIRYFNMIEVFGIDPARAGFRMEEFLGVADEAERYGLAYSLVPHSVYAVSRPLFRLLRDLTGNNKVTTIHFLETGEEKRFLSDHSGSLALSYKQSGLMPLIPETVKNHTDAVMKEITKSGNLILVHNTYADSTSVRKTLKRPNTFWCLCPASNIYIEKKIPPAEMLVAEGCEIVIGTDSLASNSSLSILEELKILQLYFPAISMEQLIRWATVNGARALGEEKNYGTIETGKKPGLLLLENLDLINLKMLPETTVTRLL